VARFLSEKGDGQNCFVGAWLAADPKRVGALPGALTLRSKLLKSVKDIHDSLLSADPVALDPAEVNALVFFSRMFAIADQSHPAHGRLARWTAAFEPHAQAVTDYPVSRSVWVHAAKSAKRILIVSGRNRKAHKELLLWLKDLHLDPVVLEAHASHGSATTPEALEIAMAGCGTGIVLATPDDQGRLVVDEDGRAPRPGRQQKSECRTRQNVVLELGMLWGHLGRERIIILLDESVVLGTDMAGFMTIRFKGDVRSAHDQLRQKLQAMGVIAVRPL
jgi:predicted nucleotide-binding protein